MPTTPRPNGKHDVWTARLVVLGLAVTGAAGTLIVGYIAATCGDIPPSLTCLAGAAIGALASTLAAIMKGENQCSSRRSNKRSGTTSRRR